jgi:hypothetical protein
LLALEISFPCERGGKTLGGKEEKAFTTDDWEKMSMQSPGEEENQFSIHCWGKTRMHSSIHCWGKTRMHSTNHLLTSEHTSFHFNSYGAGMNRKCNKKNPGFKAIYNFF